MTTNNLLNFVVISFDNKEPTRKLFFAEYMFATKDRLQNKMMVVN